MNARLSSITVASTSAKLRKASMAGSSLLLFIALATLINTGLELFAGSQESIAGGLGVTRAINSFALFLARIDGNLLLFQIAALMLSLLLTALLLLAAFFVRRSQPPALTFGISFMALDSLLLLAARDWYYLLVQLLLLAALGLCLLLSERFMNDLEERESAFKTLRRTLPF